MKTLKSYRFSAFTLDYLKELSDYWPDCTETEIVEVAIKEMLIRQRMREKNKEFII